MELKIKNWKARSVNSKKYQWALVKLAMQSCDDFFFFGLKSCRANFFKTYHFKGIKVWLFFLKKLPFQRDQGVIWKTEGLCKGFLISSRNAARGFSIPPCFGNCSIPRRAKAGNHSWFVVCVSTVTYFCYGSYSTSVTRTFQKLFFLSGTQVKGLR